MLQKKKKKERKKSANFIKFLLSVVVRDLRFFSLAPHIKPMLYYYSNFNHEGNEE